MSESPENEVGYVSERLSYHNSVFIQKVQSATFRRGVAYRVAGSDPEFWRIRIELFPQHVEGGGDWLGGKVLWGHDQARREDAEAIARAWAADGVRPFLH